MASGYVTSGRPAESRRVRDEPRDPRARGAVFLTGPRAVRVRRWARRSFDELTGETQVRSSPECDGRHHQGESCDWWRTCSGLAYGMPERDCRGRELAGAAWSP